jgi:hypothetical protein
MTGSERGRKKKGRQVPVKEEIGRASRSKEGGYSQSHVWGCRQKLLKKSEKKK